MPLPHIRKTLRSFPDTATLFFISFPFTFVYFSVIPLEFSFSRPPTLLKISCIIGIVRIVLIAEPLFLIIDEISLEYFSVFIEYKPLSFPGFFINIKLSEIEPLVNSFHFKFIHRDLLEDLKMRLIFVLDPLSI